jgi:hypothetical protein
MMVPKRYSSYGDLSPALLNLLTLAYDKVEIRTAFTPPVTIDLLGPSDPDTEAATRLVQPALIFTGNAGRAEIAPYGVPEGYSSEAKQLGIAVAIGLGAAVVGTMLLGGRVFGR